MNSIRQTTAVLSLDELFGHDVTAEAKQSLQSIHRRAVNEQLTAIATYHRGENLSVDANNNVDENAGTVCWAGMSSAQHFKQTELFSIMHQSDKISSHELQVMISLLANNGYRATIVPGSDKRTVITVTARNGRAKRTKKSELVVSHGMWRHKSKIGYSG